MLMATAEAAQRCSVLRCVKHLCQGGENHLNLESHTLPITMNYEKPIGTKPSVDLELPAYGEQRC